MFDTLLPIRRKVIHEDQDQRLRVHVDLDAKKIDACYVSLLGEECYVRDYASEGWTHERLWAETMRTGAWLRTQVANPYPAALVPYVEVTLTDSDRESARIALRNAMLVGYAFEDQDWERRIKEPAQHENRVNYLGQAVDLLAFLSTGKRSNVQ
jgi:hypothetical protein